MEVGKENYNGELPLEYSVRPPVSTEGLSATAQSPMNVLILLVFQLLLGLKVTGVSYFSSIFTEK